MTTGIDGSPDVRKASMADIPDLLALINANAAQGIMLPRTEFEMAENIRDFTVIHAGGTLLGCAALHFYTPNAAEIRSLAMDPRHRGAGGGRRLVDALVKEAQAFDVADVFAFTYVPDFFRKLGFVEIERGALPLKAWKDCLRCPKFQCCDEIAVVKHLGSPQLRAADALVRLDAAPPHANSPVAELVLPVISKSR
ncbi:MAG TPA: N-acetyltransferase [Bryobacteraceae bacterium]